MQTKPTYEELMQRVEMLERAVSGRDAVEAKLVHAEKQSIAWLENSPVCTKILDLDNNLQYMSCAGITGLGIDNINDFYGRPYPFAFFPEEFQETMSASMEKVKATGEVATQEGAVVGLKGDDYWFQSTVVPVFDDNEELDYIIIVSVETTEQHRAEIALETAVLEAEAANRAKSDFLANMSHEIRTPMNGVLGMAELMLKSDVPDDVRDNVGIIHESGTTLMAILNDILDISKIEASGVELDFIETDLVALTDSAFELMKAGIVEKGLVFRQPASTDLMSPIVTTDATRVRQVLLNLLDNAKKFTDAGGIELSISQSPMTGDRVETRIEVSDTGIGLSQDQQTRIFGSFCQADGSTTRKYGGTGLGLSISKAIISLMGGDIGVDSLPGQGSTFWFTFVSAKANAHGGRQAGKGQSLNNAA